MRKIRKTARISRQLARVLLWTRADKSAYAMTCLRAAVKAVFSSGVPKLKRT